MRLRSLRSRFALALVMAAVLSVGLSSFVPASFACGTNAGAGNCKESASENASIRDWSGSGLYFAGVIAYFGL